MRVARFSYALSLGMEICGVLVLRAWMADNKRGRCFETLAISVSKQPQPIPQVDGLFVRSGPKILSPGPFLHVQ